MININKHLAFKLIESQFPQYLNFAIESMGVTSHDNQMFRLGSDLVIRIPSDEIYSLNVKIEQRWLPKLAPYLSFSIPVPIHMGIPCKEYPWDWSIYNWIDGVSLNMLDKSSLDLDYVAWQLATFIKELHKVTIMDRKVLPGKRNFYRGRHVKEYDSDFRKNLACLPGVIDVDMAFAIWNEAMNSRWQRDPVWIHGDLAVGNILLKDKKINGIIDFGGMAIGDPACDLVMYWNFFDEKSRQIFKKELNLDQDTWNRARAWSLWKACFEIATKDSSSDEYLKWLDMVDIILSTE